VEPLRAKLERERPAIVNPRPRGKGAAKKKGKRAAEAAATNGAPAEPAKVS
jgi:hypothetical protein